MTKSHKTMCGICQAYAAALGPRVLGEGPGRLLGYYLTIKEVRALYAENDFNVSPKRRVIFEHFENWELCEWAKISGEGEDIIVWFKCPDGQKCDLNRQAERYLIPVPRIIYDPYKSEVLA